MSFIFGSLTSSASKQSTAEMAETSNIQIRSSEEAGKSIVHTPHTPAHVNVMPLAPPKKISLYTLQTAAIRTGRDT